MSLPTSAEIEAAIPEGGGAVRGDLLHRVLDKLAGNAITPEQYGAVANEDGADGDANYYTEIMAAINAAKADGKVLTGNGKTYRTTSPIHPALVSGDKIWWRDITFEVVPSAGVDVYLIYLDGGALGAAIPVTSDVAAVASSVTVAGATKPVAGARYWLIDDRAGTFETSPSCTKAHMVEIADSYDGSSSTVPLKGETLTSFAAASNARLRLCTPQNIDININNVSVIGPSNAAITSTGLVTRNLNNPRISLASISKVHHRGYLDIGSWSPDFRVSRIEDPQSTGLAYGVAFAATQHGRGHVITADYIGIVYTAGATSFDGESLPARMNDFPFATVTGNSRSVLDTHPGAFDTFFGGVVCATSVEQSASDDMVVFSGSRNTVYGPIVARGGSFRHGVIIQQAGCTDTAGEVEYTRLQDVACNYGDACLLVLNAANNTNRIEVTYDTLSGSGPNGVWVQPTSADMVVVGKRTRINASNGRAIYVLTQSPGNGRGFVYPGTVDLVSNAQAVVEVNGAAYHAANAANGGKIYLPAGSISRSNGAGTFHLSATRGEIVCSADTILTVDGTSERSVTSNGVVTFGASNQSLETTSAPTFAGLTIANTALGTPLYSVLTGPGSHGAFQQFNRGTSFTWWSGITSASNFVVRRGSLASPVDVVVVNGAAPASSLTIDATGEVNAAIAYDTAGEFRVAGTKVVGARGAAIADAAGGTEITTINAILARLRDHGLIAP